MINHSIDVFVGLASGLVVGTGFVAFITVLGILPRLIQLSKTREQLHLYEFAVIIGVLFGTYVSFTPFPIRLGIIVIMFWGLLHGTFVGMLSAALTEVLNVFPLLAKRVGIDNQIIWLMMAIVFGKIAGSLFQWIIFVKL
ncbi:stage V sporulation protein AB [Paraliobacillus ryukyuensis]|uniref:stage V sporulation protein AB n=1 Tax=Paraliobacillus ryukyuensis TaxID=200904 RepID=UPI0009A7948B|nr:stage V sporulation protein AB [Paraliobacillus ryukyuensis]